MILKFKVTSSSWWTEKSQITYASIPGSKSDSGIGQENMGRTSNVSSTEWLKYLGHLELANSFLFCCVLLLVFASDKLRLRVAVPLKLVFSVEIKITGRSSGGCLSPNKA